MPCNSKNNGLVHTCSLAKKTNKKNPKTNKKKSQIFSVDGFSKNFPTVKLVNQPPTFSGR